MAYASLYKTVNNLRQYRNPYTSSSYSNSYGGGKRRGLSEYETELLPKVQEAEAKRTRRKKWLRPVEFVFDVLSRGQYATANIAKQITRNSRAGRPIFEGIPREAWEGLRGKEKGDWSTVIWGGEDKGGEKFQGWGQKAGDRLEKTWLGRRAKGAAALAANILLDPTTYIPGFGASKLTKGAAREATEDLLKIAAKKIGTEVGERLGPQALKQAVDVKQIVKGKDFYKVNRELSKQIKEAQHLAKRYTAPQLREIVAKRAEEAKEGLKKSFGTPAQGELFEQVAPGVKDLDDLITKLRTTDAYKGAGTRAMSFLGKEIKATRGERYPVQVKAWDKMIEKLRESKVGGMYQNAWWSVMANPKSPVAKLRQAFNIRTPYMQYLSNIKQDLSGVSGYITEDLMREVHDAAKNLTPDELEKMRMAWIQIQHSNYPIENALSLMGSKSEEIAKIAPVQKKWQEILDKIHATEVDIVKKDPSLVGKTEGWLPGFIAQYFPMMTKRTDMTLFPKSADIPTMMRPFKQRTTTQVGMEQLEKNVFKLLDPGLTDDQIMELMKTYKMSRYVETDPYKLMMGRIYAHGRFQQNVKMIEQFREFGVNIADIAKRAPEAEYALTHNWQDLGLQTIADNRLEGYLFDPEVATIFQRVLQPVQSDETLRGFMKAFSSGTSWWKGMVTLSPGFHLRNAFQNQFTLWMKHGADAFNPDYQMRAAVGAAYALYGDKGRDVMKALGITPQRFNEILDNTVFGEKNLRELSTLARQRLVVSPASQAFSPASTIEEMAKKSNWNPFSAGFKPIGASRKVGSFIESQPRFLSFMLDYQNAGGTEAALDWAGWEARKWFIDYTDLSPFEQKVLKNVIPFYTWLRKNMANQMIGMMEMPEMYSLMPKIMSGGPEAEAMPEYMRDVGYFPISQILGQKDEILRMFWPNLGYMDINKIPLRFEMSDEGFPIPRIDAKDLISNVLGMAHPLIKSAAEMVGPDEQVWDVYYRRNLREGEANPEIANKLSRFVVANPKILSAVDGILQSFGVEGGLSANVDAKGRLTIDPKIGRLLNNNIPLLMKISQYMDLPEYLVEVIKDTKNKVQDEKDNYNRAALGLRTMAFYLGIKEKDVNISEQLGYEADEILREAEKETAEARRKKPQYQKTKLNLVRAKMLKKRRMGL